MGKDEGITAVGDFQDEDGRYVELKLMPQLPHSVKAGIYEVYAFHSMTVGEAHSRPIATGTYYNLERLFKNFRQHVNPKEGVKDAKEYNALNNSIDERERQFQIEGDLFSP